MLRDTLKNCTTAKSKADLAKYQENLNVHYFDEF